MSDRGDTLPATAPGGGARASVAPALFLIACGTARVEPLRLGLRDLDEVDLRRGEGVSGERRRFVVAVPDPRMSSTHARLVHVRKQWHVEDLQSRNGTFVNGERVEHHVLSDGDIVDLGDTIWRYRELPCAGERVTVSEAMPRGMRTLVPSFHEELVALRRVAASSLSVLVEGETGTGKELIARAVHVDSARAGKLVAVNCGALPRERVAAELFGWRRGAFPGALADHLGLVRAADGGTLFLDEVADLPVADQATLLRALQEHEVLPIAATQPIRVDLRVVCATHMPLDALVDDEAFRRDLLARLSGFRIGLLPVRERREDLGILVGDLLAAHGGAGAPIRAATWRALLAYDWPANVRELEQVLMRALVRRDADGALAIDLPRAAAIRDTHRDRLVASLRAHGGNIAAVARELGKARMQIQRWLRRYEIDPEDYRAP